jgi:protein TonB
MAVPGSTKSSAKRLLHTFLVVVFGVGLTVTVFYVLPLLQAISKARKQVTVIEAATVAEPPPPDVVEQQEEEPPEEEEPPPELEEQPDQLASLSELEISLNPGGAGGSGPGVAIDLSGITGGGFGSNSSAFTMAELDKKPRVLYQAQPNVTSAVRRVTSQTDGVVMMIFIVDENGRVKNPKVERSSHSVLEKPALVAVRQWRFSPGQRGGKPVPFRMRVPISFPQGL